MHTPHPPGRDTGNDFFIPQIPGGSVSIPGTHILYETYIKVCLVTTLKVLKIKRQLKHRQCVLLIYSD